MRHVAERGTGLAAERVQEMGPLLGRLLSISFGTEWDARLAYAAPEQVRHQTCLAVRDLLLALALLLGVAASANAQLLPERPISFGDGVLTLGGDVCLKLLPRILQSDQPFGVKAEAFFHLTANFNYLLMSLLSILMFPSMVIRYNMGWYEMLLIDVPLFFAATASVGLASLRMTIRDRPSTSSLKSSMARVPTSYAVSKSGVELTFCSAVR